MSPPEDRPLPVIRLVALAMLAPIVLYTAGWAVWSVVSLTDFSLPTYRNRPELGYAVYTVLYAFGNLAWCALWIAAVFTVRRGGWVVAVLLLPLLPLDVGLSVYTLSLSGLDLAGNPEMAGILVGYRVLEVSAKAVLIGLAGTIATRLAWPTTLLVVMAGLVKLATVGFDLVVPTLFGLDNGISMMNLLGSLGVDLPLVPALVGALLLVWRDRPPAS